MQRLPLALGALLLLAPALAGAADAVVASERVESFVIVREAASRTSPRVGELRPGERADYLGAAPSWRRVRLADGTLGFVSEAWTRVVPQAARARTKQRPASRMLRGFLRRSSAPDVELVIHDPAFEIYRNTDPVLPVAGFARLAKSAHEHDIVLVLDLSTSTNEHSGTDVNGDGVVDDGWKGPDSIFAAQVTAARNFVRELGKLPHNRKGERIRVGIVTYAGEERFHLNEPDRLDVDEDAIFRFASRDAAVPVPLTHDYRAVDRELARLARKTPIGMTDAAAGVGRALAELQGLSLRGARSQVREAQKVIFFLTDGKPRLPYDRDVAEEAAIFAGRMAQQANVRINAFTLGENKVTRKENRAVKRMVRRTGGQHVTLERPGDIVAELEATSFSVVDRVSIINRSTDAATRSVATGIDGSFFGELPLREGPNEIEVVAHLTDGREQARIFNVQYVVGAPERELQQQLKRVRMENEVLIDRIKKDLALEIVRARKRQKQRRQLEVRGEPEAWPAAGD